MCLAKRLLGTPLLGHVSNDGRKSDQTPEVLSSGLSDMSPEPCIILPSTPTLSLECAFCLAHFDVALGNPEVNVLGDVKRRMVPSHNIVGPITENSLCSDVPARNSPIGSEHDDGVVTDALDH